MGENKFLLILIGVTLVGVIGLVAWGMSVGGSVEEKEMAERQELVDKIESIRPPFKNTETIEADKARVRVVLDSLATVKTNNRQWNSRNFTIPTLSLVGGRTTPALPYDPDLWKDNELLRFNFIREYHSTLGEYLKTLSPTDPPLASQLQAEALRQQERIDYRQAVEEKQAVGSETSAGRRDPRGGLAMPPDDMGMAPAGPSRRRSAVGGNTQVGDEALQIAEANLALRNARQGMLYATVHNFDAVVPFGSESTAQLDAHRVWVMMVARWVQCDIAAAIGQTNKDILARTGQSPTVPASAIKRLYAIQVGELAGSGEARVLSPVMGEDENRSQMMPEMGRSRSRSKSKSELPKSNTLTEYASNPIFDVVQYKFTVLMPVRLLPLLEKNLTKQNYHIIINEQILQPDAVEEASGRGRLSVRPGPTGMARGGTAEGDEPTELYYYGTEAVHKIIITCQLLLTTEFTRGMWNEQQETWQYPPLMPLSVMRQLPEAALRPQDEKLLEGDLPTPWMSAAPAKPETSGPGRRRR